MSKKTALKRRNTNGQQIHEKVLNITNCQQHVKSKTQQSTMSLQLDWLLSRRKKINLRGTAEMQINMVLREEVWMFP